MRSEIAGNKEFINLMGDCGCRRVYAGFESINQETLQLFTPMRLPGTDLTKRPEKQRSLHNNSDWEDGLHIGYKPTSLLKASTHNSGFVNTALLLPALAV